MNNERYDLSDAEKAWLYERHQDEIVAAHRAQAGDALNVATPVDIHDLIDDDDRMRLDSNREQAASRITRGDSEWFWTYFARRDA